MKNVWNFLVWKYQRSTRSDLFFYSGVISWALTIFGIATSNQTMVWLFGIYAVTVFVVGWIYWTFITFLRREYEEFKKERRELFDIIKRGQ